jgi:predicted  nucleic acid-binding Zn-ribbon protein
MRELLEFPGVIRAVRQHPYEYDTLQLTVEHGYTGQLIPVSSQQVTILRGETEQAFNKRVRHWKEEEPIRDRQRQQSTEARLRQEELARAEEEQRQEEARQQQALDRAARRARLENLPEELASALEVVRARQAAKEAMPQQEE